MAGNLERREGVGSLVAVEGGGGADIRWYQQLLGIVSVGLSLARNTLVTVGSLTWAWLPVWVWFLEGEGKQFHKQLGYQVLVILPTSVMGEGVIFTPVTKYAWLKVVVDGSVRLASNT